MFFISITVRDLTRGFDWMKYLSRLLRWKMAGIVEDSLLSRSDHLMVNSSRCQSRNSAILQYQPGEERFKLKLQRNGKEFNFHRSVTETVNSIKERIVTNMSKKVKNFDADIKIFVKEEEVFDDSMQTILDNGLQQSNILKIHIGDDVLNVDFNPPEISQMKFLKNVMVGFPTFPAKIEATTNFNLKKSICSWEVVKPKVKAREKSGDKTEEKVDKPFHTSLVYFPAKEMTGCFLRFTCIPSDGQRFGVPFSVETTTPVGDPPVSDLIFHERLSRLRPKENLYVTRVVSYNCLADTYATPEWFSFSPPSSLDIDYRLPLLNQEIMSYDGDIICLQEVDTKYYEGNFQPFLDIHCNFEGAFSSKIGNTKEGAATFFNREKFLLLTSETVVIVEHTKSLPMWTSVLSKNEALINRLAERNTILQVNVVKSKLNPNLLLVVANTHLYFHPDADHIRLIQTITCIDYIQKIVKRLEKGNPDKMISLIFCGDFNCTPPFSSFRLLTTGNIGADDDDWFSHGTEQLVPGVEFNHHLGLTNSHAGEELTNITMQFEGCIDYILYQADKIKLLNAYPPPDKSVLANLTETSPPKVSLPNYKTPSDHLPLIADFVLPKLSLK